MQFIYCGLRGQALVSRGLGSHMSRKARTIISASGGEVDRSAGDDDVDEEHGVTGEPLGAEIGEQADAAEERRASR
jgi:hypothetical protein